MVERSSSNYDFQSSENTTYNKDKILSSNNLIDIYSFSTPYVPEHY